MRIVVLDIAPAISKFFFLNSKMHFYQYMHLHRCYITKEIINEYHITDNFFDSKGYIYLEIRKGMYGPKEAAILAYEQLREHLAKSGYVLMKHTPGLWRNESFPTTFTLAVDNFGITYFNKSDDDHLFKALGEKYSLTIDWTGSGYLGITLDWHYDEGFVEISMPDYVPKALTKFGHCPPTRLQHDPHLWTSPVCGQKVQYATKDLSTPLNKKGTLRVQAVSGIFLYYGCAVGPNIPSVI